ncbi:glucose-1-phosphate adenylyltransferase subunit GlgD [Caldicellulosiruptoraceae bacterium PP1]
MLNDYMGIISLNEDDIKIKSLTIHRPLASIPIFGRYRIIDFILSNLVNSGITNVAIFAHSNSRSLYDHLGTGKPWDLNRKIDGLFIFNHSLDNTNISDMKQMKNNMEYLCRSKKNKVIFSTSQMIYNINFEEAAKFHEESGADVTIIYKKVRQNSEMFDECDLLNISNERVISVGKNMGITNTAYVSLDTFILSKDFLIKSILNCLEFGNCTSFKNYIYQNVSTLNVNAFEFKGYLSRINSISSYYKTSMDILNLEIRNELFFKNGLIYTKSNDSPPTRYFSSSEVTNSLISNGCIIKGKVKNSILSRGVVIEEDAFVEDSIIFPKCVVKSGALLKNVILDKNVVIDEHVTLVGDKKFPIVMEKVSLVNIK